MRKLGLSSTERLLASNWWEGRTAEEILRFALFVDQPPCPQEVIQRALDTLYPHTKAPPYNLALEAFGGLAWEDRVAGLPEVRDVIDPHGSGLDQAYYELVQRCPIVAIRDEEHLDEVRKVQLDVIVKIAAESATPGEREWYMATALSVVLYNRGVERESVEGIIAASAAQAV